MALEPETVVTSAESTRKPKKITRSDLRCFATQTLQSANGTLYWEACLNENDAARREKYLKTAWEEALHQNKIKNVSHGQITFLTGEIGIGKRIGRIRRRGSS